MLELGVREEIINSYKEGKMLKVEIITSKNDFYSLKDKWNELLNESCSKSIYLTWEWLYTWWEVYGDSIRNLHILIVKDEKDKIIAIAPLLIRIKKTVSLITCRILEFLGTGEDEKDEVCSNYMDFIVKNNSENIYKLIFNYIHQGFKEKKWEKVSLNSVPYSSGMIKFLNNGISQSLNKGNYSVNISDPISCAVINLPEKWDDYLHYINKSWRNQINRGRKEILNVGNIECELITKSDKLPTAFNEFINLHQKRWQDVGKSGIFSSQKFTAFHKKILEIFADNNWVRIRLLKCNGKIVAASYNFNYNKTIYFYSSAYNRNFKTKIGIGLIERSYDIEDAIKDGYKYYDFYKAKEGSYKWHLAKNKREVCDILIFKKSPTYYLSVGIKYTKTAIRKIRNLCLGKKK